MHDALDLYSVQVITLPKDRVFYTAFRVDVLFPLHDIDASAFVLIEHDDLHDAF